MSRTFAMLSLVKYAPLALLAAAVGLLARRHRAA